MGEAQGFAWASQAGAEFSNPFTSELARDCEITSPSRSASGPAWVLGAGPWTLDSFRHGIVKTHRPLASRAALLFRAA